MLQIISGKFFDLEKPINKSYEYEVLYSNFYCYSPIRTQVFELTPINSHPEKINKFLIKYENKYEPTDEKDVLYLPSTKSVVFHIQYLMTFYFNAYFHREKSHVEKMCSTNHNPKENENISSIHLPHIFNLKKDNFSDIELFIEFIDKVMLLERKSYNLFIKLLKAYYNALEAFSTNYELSYMTLVYLLETLATEIKLKELEWVDFDDNKKNQLDKIFVELEQEKVNKIKKILLKDSSLKLKKQFVNNLYDLTYDDFFEAGKESKGTKILKSELIHVLNNLYFTRSKYVHKLDSLEKVVLTHGYNKSNFLYDNDNPKFSIYGLSIYTKYILNNFLNQSNLVHNEDYPWRKELDGIITVNLAPQYWVWKYEGLKPEHLHSKFNGFIELLLVKNQVLDIKKLLLKIEKMFGQLNDDYLASALSLYILYNIYVSDDSKLSKWGSILKKYGKKLEKCSIQYLVISLYVSIKYSWDIKEQEKVLNTYYKNKFKQNAIRLMNIVEIQLLSKIANQYLSMNEDDKYIEYLNKAILESGNNIAIYQYLKKMKEEKKKIDLKKIKT